ncbi:MAG: FtsX-like permease family protein [Chlorobi bacterium]|nr:FtsX-like permease family protein [Chlorobiota bacterium]
MIWILIKTSFRNLQRFRLFSLINVLGLAFGMAIVFIILLFVWHEFSADRFHTNYDNIYRIEGSSSPSVTYPTGTIIRQAIPEIKASSLMSMSILNYSDPENDNTFEIHISLVDNSFFDIFTFPFVVGNKTNALVDPNSIVLSESMAHKIFGDTNAVGKIVALKDNFHHLELHLKVTGVMEDVPSNSSIITDAFASIELATKTMNRKIKTDWRNWSFQLFVLMNSNSTPVDVLPKINETLHSSMVESGWKTQEELDKDLAEGDYSFTYQAFGDLYFSVSDYWLNHGNKKLARLYLFIAIIILTIAVINYINLSTSIASQRAKEIGLRKLLGADKKGLLSQIFFETLTITLIALVLSLLLIELFQPVILDLLPKNVSLPNIYNPVVLLIYLTGGIFIAFISSLYPALFLFRFMPMDVVKPSGSINLKSGNVRRALIFFQFMVSGIFVFSVILVWEQLDYLRNYDSGFKQENIISIRASYDIMENSQVFRNKLSQIPGIKNISFSENIPADLGSYWGGEFSNGYEYNFAKIDVDSCFMDIFGLRVIKGKTFREALLQGEEYPVLINEKAEREINSPEVLNLSFRDENYRIVGIVRDFNFLSAKEPIEPLMLIYKPHPNWGRAIIELYGSNMETINKISGIWGTLTNAPFDYSFVKDDYARAIGNEEKLADIIGGFTVVSLVLCFLGLFGLVTFMLDRRTKEMGIRKVLGASYPELFALLSREFVRLVVVANIIGLPVAWFFLNKWLTDFPNRITISWWMFLVSIVLLSVLSLITILIKSNHVFKTNPVDALKYE